MARHQRRECHGEDAGLDVVDAADERRDDSEREKRRCGPEGAVAAQPQAPRHDEQGRPDDAPHKVRHLDDLERDDARQPRHPAPDGRQRARHEKHGPGGERRRGECARHEVRQPRPGSARRQPRHAGDPPRDGLVVPLQFGPDEHERRHGKRQQVVHGAVRHKRAQRDVRRHHGREQRHQHTVEHAQPARHHADDARDDGEQVDRQQVPERDRPGGEQHKQDERRDGEVDRGDGGLPERHPPARHVDGPPPELDGPVANDVEGQPRAEERHEDDAERARRDREAVRRRRRVHDQHRAAERQVAHPERQPREGDDLGDGLGRDAPRGVEPVAHGAARQDGVAERDREREADEGRECAPCVRQPLADVAQRERVVGRQHDVVERRQRDGHGDAPRWDRAERRADVVQVVAAQLAVDEPQRPRRDGEPDEREQTTKAMHRVGRNGRAQDRHAESAVPRRGAPHLG